MDPTLSDQLRQLGAINQERQLEALRNLPDQSVDALDELETKFVRRFDALTASGAVADKSTFARATLLTEAIEAIREEASKRSALIASLTSRVRPAPPAAPAAPAADASPETPTRPSIADIARRVPASARPTFPTTDSAPATIVAAATGEELGGARDVGAELLRTWERAANDTGGGEQFYPAVRVEADYPDERKLGLDRGLNMERIDAVVGQRALVAAGGLCAPVSGRYDLQQSSTSARPIRDALAQFMADRGGVRYIAPPQLADVAGGVVVHTEAEDVAATAKPVQVVACGAEQEVVVHAVPYRLRFGNFSARFFPEQVETFAAKALAQQARVAEDELLVKLGAGSVATTTARLTGATRDLLDAIDRASAAYRFRARLTDTQTLRAILPAWAKSVARADLARQMPGDAAMGVTDEQIDAWFSARHIAATFHLDGTGFAAQGAGALLGFPGEVDWFLFAEGSWLFLDGGVLDLGIVRDATLNSANNFEIFAETFEGAAYVGDAGTLRVTSSICSNGASVAGQAPTACV